MCGMDSVAILWQPASGIIGFILVSRVGTHPASQPATHPPRVRVSKGVPDDPNSCLEKGDFDGFGGLKAKSE